jgi:hypothetical protein
VATSRNDIANPGLLTVEVEQLCEALRRPAATLGVAIAAKFGRLADLVAALPLTTDEYCFAANWIAGARDCWAAAELGAARYQLEMVRKNLSR